VFTQNLIKGPDWLNNLKLHVAYGKSGNANIQLNQYQATVGFYSYAVLASIRANNLGNTLLSWENMHQYDVGLNFRVANHLTGDITYYRKNSYDLLFNVPLSYTTGFSNQTRNNGKLYNQGVEVTLNAQIFRSKHISWSLGGNFTYNHNKITSLPRTPGGKYRNNTTSTRYIAEVGFPVRSWHMKEWAGVNPKNGQPQWYKNVLDSDGNPTGKRVKTSDYSEADRYFLGSARPTKYGGVQTQLNLFGFNIKANMYYATGFKIFNDWANYFHADGQNSGIFNHIKSQTDYWKKPGDHAANPKPALGGLNPQSNSASSRYLYDGSYLRLKTLRVGYALPSSVLQNIGVNHAEIYFLGQNLWTHTFDPDLQFDPEVGPDVLTDLFSKPLKSITFGINVKF
jgi:hypothetical protein